MYETAEASVMLIYILAGIEAYRKVYPKQPGEDVPPELSGIEFFPVVSAANSDELFNQESTIVQMAYIGLD